MVVIRDVDRPGAVEHFSGRFPPVADWDQETMVDLREKRWKYGTKNRE
jgi:hypothetical protein